MRFLLLILLAGCNRSSLPGGGDGGVPDGGGGSDGGACMSSVAPAAGLVVTDRGPVQGVSSSGTWAFFAIPYAAPPVGGLRWQPPAPHDCWSQPLAATSFASACVQLDATGAVTGDEDCLTVNVWAPSSATATSALPVLFFVHGGGNVQGSAAEKHSGVFIYDGAALAAQTGAVVVTFNYRLGPLGFLAHPAFAAESANHSAGDYGTLDQIAALAFVQRNVAAFGGDPARVLLFGESAGAVDVCALVASPLAKGVFAAALMESGACTAKTSTEAQTFAGGWAQKAGCASGDVASCLRALDAKTVEQVIPESADVASSKQNDYQPNADGWVLADNPQKVLTAGQHNHVPFVVGSNANETGQAIVTAYPMGMTATQFSTALLAFAGGNQTTANAIAAQYPASDYGNDPRAAFIALSSDAKFICTARYVARAAVAGQSEPVYRYFYTHQLDGTPIGATVKAEGAWHGQELLPLFRHMTIAGYTPSAGEGQLSDAMDGYWSRLASGDPNGGGAPAWPRYDATTDPFLQLDDTTQAGAGVRTAQCDFWDQLLGR
jgi:para-nitrobenzyl esterase